MKDRTIHSKLSNKYLNWIKSQYSTVDNYTTELFLASITRATGFIRQNHSELTNCYQDNIFEQSLHVKKVLLILIAGGTSFRTMDGSQYLSRSVECVQKLVLCAKTQGRLQKLNVVSNQSDIMTFWSENSLTTFEYFINCQVC